MRGVTVARYSVTKSCTVCVGVRVGVPHRHVCDDDGVDVVREIGAKDE